MVGALGLYPDEASLLTFACVVRFRYGRSKTTFTFEAGRKCASGEGYFTFKVDSGDAVFSAVQKRTKEMKKNIAVAAAASAVLLPAGNYVNTSPRSNEAPDGPSPALPARQYGPEEEAKVPAESVNNKVSLFEAKAKSKAPPQIKKLNTAENEADGGNKPRPVPGGGKPKPKVNLGVTHPVEGGDGRLGVKGGTRMTQGYELGRTVFHTNGKPESSPQYEAPDRIKTVDVSYKEASPGSSGKGPGSPGSPVYAVYDLLASSRVQAQAPVYDNPASPYYDTALPVSGAPEQPITGVSMSATTSTTSSFEYEQPHGEAWRRQPGDAGPPHGHSYTGSAVDAGGCIYEDPDKSVTGAEISAISERLKQQRPGAEDSDQYDRIGGRKALGGGGGGTPPQGRAGRAPLPERPPADSSQYGQLSTPRQKARGKKLFNFNKK